MTRRRWRRRLLGALLGVAAYGGYTGTAHAQATATPVPTPTAVPTICAYAPRFLDAGLPAKATAQVASAVIPSAGGATLIPAAGAGLRTYILGMTYSAAGATVVTVDAGGTTIDRANIPANALVAHGAATTTGPLCTPVNTVVTASQSGSVTTYVSVRYVFAP